MKVEKLKNNEISIRDNDIVRVKETGNIMEIMYSANRTHSCNIRKISKDEYIDIRTGEIKKINHIADRTGDLESVARSLAYGRDLINANVTDVEKCRWITLTYAENMTDQKRILKHFENFVKRLRQIFGNFEYIIAVEPQQRGAWHMHCIFIFPCKAPFMKNSIVADAWKQGFVTVKKLNDIDNVGAYLTAYLSDLELSGVSENNAQIKEIEFLDKNGQKKTKKYIKGARLFMYPPGMHIFRWSRGIKKPVIYEERYKNIKEKIGSLRPTFSNSLLLDTGSFVNFLRYDYYNKLRK